MSKKQETHNIKSDYPTKMARAAWILREAILTGALKSGQQLKQQEIAEQMGMSSTPIREILRQLEAEGLVEYLPRKGVFVSEMTADQYREAIPIRTCLEALAVSQTSGKLDTAALDELTETQALFEDAWRMRDLSEVGKQNYYFHMRIYEASGSALLCELIRRIWPRFASDLLWIVPGRVEVSIDQHQGILTALRAGDTEEAAQQMAEHITKAGEMIGDYITFQQQSEEASEDILGAMLEDYDG